MSSYTTLRIKEIIQETANAVSLIFDIPSSQKKDFSFIPGQFLGLKAMINGKEVRRAYSISSSPENNDIQVSVKKIADGTFSVYANEKLVVGDTLEAMIPEGKFQLQPNTSSSKNYMAFAAGSGITPIMSMIKAVLSVEESSKFVLVYGNKSNEETMFFKELLELQTSFPDRFFVEFIFSQKNTEGAKFGRIDKSIVNYTLKNKFDAIEFNDYYLCGPEAMIDSVKGVLTENSIPENKIHFELFTSSADASNDGNTEGISKVEVLVDDETITIESDKKATLLDNILKADIDAPYSCKGGVCASCICRVTDGKVNMPVNNLLTDAEIAEGLVLSCQAYAVSDEIKLDFDDA